MNKVCMAIMLGSLGWMTLGCPAADLKQDMSLLLSQLQAMGVGYHSPADWGAMEQQIERMAARAESEGAWDEAVDLQVVKAMVLSDMKNEHQQALDVLRKAKNNYNLRARDSMKKIYVLMAEIYARLGDESAIGRLIEEFRNSPYYDPENYAYSGGKGRDVPLSITRPGARGGDSITITAMEKFRDQARQSEGNEFPDIAATAMDGRIVKLSELRGRVVLVDFWVRGWEPWKRDLPTLLSLNKRYAKAGFSIIGICIEPNPTGLEQWLKDQEITWPQVMGDSKLTSKLGIFGEATSFLLDKNGMVIGRNLSGSALVDAVKKAL